VDVDAAVDQRFFFLRIEISEQGILCVGVRCNLVAGFDGLFAAAGGKFQRPRVAQVPAPCYRRGF
jgi:hypothetical protein